MVVQAIHIIINQRGLHHLGFSLGRQARVVGKLVLPGLIGLRGEANQFFKLSYLAHRLVAVEDGGLQKISLVNRWVKQAKSIKQSIEEAGKKRPVGQDSLFKLELIGGTQIPLR